MRTSGSPGAHGAEKEKVEGVIANLGDPHHKTFLKFVCGAAAAMIGYVGGSLADGHGIPGLEVLLMGPLLVKAIGGTMNVMAGKRHLLPEFPVDQVHTVAKPVGIAWNGLKKNMTGLALMCGMAAAGIGPAGLVAGGVGGLFTVAALVKFAAASIGGEFLGEFITSRGKASSQPEMAR